MSEDNRIEVELVLNNKGIDRPLKEQEKKFEESGKKGGENFEKGFKSGMGPLIATVAAVGSAIAGAFAVGKVIAAASQQEDAVNRLNTALKITGDYSKLASQDLQDFASQLQASSKVGDEVILENMALLKSVSGLSNEGLKPATQAALDMSAALGIDLATATTLVGKAANGEIGSLSRYGIQVEKGKDAAETFARTLDVLNTKFGGSAAGQINTYSGAIQQMENVFGDLLEEVGNLIIKSPALIEVFKFISTQITEVMSRVKDFGSQGDVLKPIILSVISFGEALNMFIIAPLELVYNAVKFVFSSVVAELNGYVALVGQALGAMADLANSAGVNNALTQGLQDFRESSKAVFGEALQDAHSAWDGIFDFNFTDKSQTFLDGLRTVVEESKAITDEGSRSMAGNNQAVLDEMAFSWGMHFNQISEHMKSFSTKTADFSKKIAQTLLQGVGASAANAFGALGAAMAKGENGLDAFMGAVLKSMGQMATQLGMMFMMEGAARTWAGHPNGPGLIAAGAALATFGGVMGAMGGGSGGANNAGGGVAVSDPGTSPGNPVFTAPEAATRQEPQTTVSLTVQGDVFDSDETGTRLLNLLNDNFNTKGSRLTGAFA